MIINSPQGVGIISDNAPDWPGGMSLTRIVKDHRYNYALGTCLL